MGPIAEFVRSWCGLDLDSTKGYLVEGRWGPLLAESGFDSYLKLCEAAQSDRLLADRLIDAICTKETSFFRDRSPFELLAQKLIPDHIGTRDGGRLRIWSVACSTGQETYSVAMVVAEAVTGSRWLTDIHGTDLSDSALSRAREGRFSKLEMERGLSLAQRERHFEEDGDGWRVIRPLRDMVTFRRMNVLQNSEDPGRFDIILCRNLASYFDIENRRRLFSRLQRHLNPSGALVIGATETLVGITDRFVLRRAHGSAYYTHAPANSAADTGI